MATRDLQLARAAFLANNTELSKEAHVASQEHHAGDAGDMIKSLVFGGLDGIITTFAIVAAVVGASLPADMVILMGVANLIADGISMGLGDYLSEKAEFEHVRHERKREVWELTNFPEGEIKEMVEIYKSHNFSEEDARTIVETMAKNKEFFVDHMLVAELGLMPVDEDDDAWKKGLVTFTSFVLFGSVPVITYGALREVDWGETSFNVTFLIACIMTGATLFALGVAKAQITKQNRLKSGALMLVNGGLAAAAAFLIGWGLEEALDL